MYRELLTDQEVEESSRLTGEIQYASGPWLAGLTLISQAGMQ